MGKISLALGLVTLMVGCASGSAGNKLASPERTSEAKALRAPEKVEEKTNPVNTEPSSPTIAQASSDGTLSEKRLVAALPTTCTNRKDCAPPKEFAEAACHGRFPSMAIAMFEKHTPWQRLYLKAVTLEAVNAYGDRNVSAPMVFGEEVLVLRGLSQPKSGQVQVSSSDIDVLRWDGTCATVARELFATTRMPNVVQAPIDWRYLEDPLQEALLKSKYVAIRYEQYRGACKLARESACQKATERLNEAIGVALRDGLTLPTPEKLPVWATPDQLKEQGTVAMKAPEP
jgi:hypothetical protein